MIKSERSASPYLLVQPGRATKVEKMWLTCKGEGAPRSGGRAQQRGRSSPERAGAQGSLWSWAPHPGSGAAVCDSSCLWGSPAGRWSGSFTWSPGTPEIVTSPWVLRTPPELGIESRVGVTWARSHCPRVSLSPHSPWLANPSLPPAPAVAPGKLLPVVEINKTNRTRGAKAFYSALTT